MKIVYTGGEFLLSGYLNFLKVPMAIFYVILVVFTLIDCIDHGTDFKDTYLYRNRRWLIALAILFNAYMFVVWN